MRSLAFAFLALVACDAPTAPRASVDGTYALESVRYENAYATMDGPVDSAAFRLTLRDGFVSGNAGSIPIRVTRADGTSFETYAYIVNAGQYEEAGDSVHILGLYDRTLIGWISGAYTRDGDRLVRRFETDAEYLLAVWRRE